MVNHKIIAGDDDPILLVRKEIDDIFLSLRAATLDIYADQVQEFIEQFKKHYKGHSVLAVIGILSRCLEVQKQLLRTVSSEEERCYLKKIINQKVKELSLVEKLHALSEGETILSLQSVRELDILIKELAEHGIGDNVRFYNKLNYDSFSETCAEKLKNKQEWLTLLKFMRNDTFFSEKEQVESLCILLDDFFKQYTGHCFGLSAAFLDSQRSLRGPENIIVSDVLARACAGVKTEELGAFDYYFQKLLKLLSPLVLTVY